MLLELCIPMWDFRTHGEINDDKVESVKGTFFLFFSFPLPKVGKKMKIPFFQERSRSYDPHTRPLCKLFCWSIGHPISTPKIAAPPWNSFLLPHINAGAQRSSADTYHHFLAGISVLNGTNNNSREAKAAFVFPLGNQLSRSWRVPSQIFWAGYRVAHQPS